MRPSTKPRLPTEGPLEAATRPAVADHPDPPMMPGTAPCPSVPPTARQPRPSRSRLVGTMAALSAVTIWGLTFVPSKIALSEMGPFTLAVLRFSLALAVLLPLAARRHRPSAVVHPVAWGTLALLGLTGVALFFGLQNLGLERTSATNAALISSTVPAITAALSAALLGEALSLPRVLGIVASTLGVAAVALAGGEQVSGSAEGDLMVLGAALSWAIYTLLCKGIGSRMSETDLLASTMAFGTLFLLPPAGLEIALSGFGPVSVAGWLSVLFLGLAGSGLSFFCWNAAVRRLDAAEASLYINLVPLVAVLAAALALGETATPTQLAGGALVIAGVCLAGRCPKAVR